MSEAVSMGIGDAARETGVGIHALRYYEQERLLQVPRSANGHRSYGAPELAALRFITQLRRTGMPIGAIRAYADMVRAGTNTAEDSLALLEAHRDAVLRNLEEQQHYLDAISRKIEVYRSQLGTDFPRDLP